MSVLRIYRLFRHRVIDTAVLLGMTLFLAHQVWADKLTYPEQFLQLPTSQVKEELSHPGVARYVDFVRGLSTHDDVRGAVEALYAEELYYSDTFMVADNREQVLTHFSQLRDNGTTFKISVYDVLEGNTGFYLVWSVDNTFKLFGSERKATSIGVTLFEFDGAGKITVQQDFWDSTEGFYQHLPVIGSALRSIRDQVGSI